MIKYPYGRFNFKSIPRVTDEVDRAIKENFPGLENLVEAQVKDVASLKKVGQETAIAIKKLANERLRELKESEKNTSTNNIQLITSSDEEVKDLDEDKYILVETPIDKFNMVRDRRKVTPSVCLECGEDICKINGLEDYEELSPIMQARVDEALIKHKEKHNISEAKIITASEMKQTSNVAISPSR